MSLDDLKKKIDAFTRTRKGNIDSFEKTLEKYLKKIAKETISRES